MCLNEVYVTTNYYKTHLILDFFNEQNSIALKISIVSKLLNPSGESVENTID